MVQKPAVAKTIEPGAIRGESQNVVLIVADISAQRNGISIDSAGNLRIGLGFACAGVPGSGQLRSRLLQHDRAVKPAVRMSKDPGAGKIPLDNARRRRTAPECKFDQSSAVLLPNSDDAERIFRRHSTEAPLSSGLVSNAIPAVRSCRS